MMYIFEVEFWDGGFSRYEIDEMEEDKVVDRFKYFILEFNRIKQVIVTKERIKK